MLPGSRRTHVDEDHGAGGERQRVDEQPLGIEVVDIGSDIRELAHGLHDCKAQRHELLVNLEALLALARQGDSRAAVPVGLLNQMAEATHKAVQSCSFCGLAELTQVGSSGLSMPLGPRQQHKFDWQICKAGCRTGLAAMNRATAAAAHHCALLTLQLLQARKH